MAYSLQSSLCGLVLVAALFAGRLAKADSPGQADLDRATQLQLTVQTLEDLNKVISLCESAEKAGLDKENTAFAHEMLAAALVHRGIARSKHLLDAREVMPADAVKLRDLALADLEKGVKLSPQQPEALLFIAQLNCLPGGDQKRALAALGETIRAADAAPDVRAQALLLRAELSEDPKQQRADLDEAVRAAPKEARVLMARGLFLENQGEADAAIADLDKVIALEPQHAVAYDTKVRLLAKQGKFDQALALLEKLRKLDSSDAHPLLQEARVHAMQSKLDAALHDLDEAAAKSPGNIEVLLLRAAVYGDLDKQDKALADLDQVLLRRPGYPPAVRSRAIVLHKTGKTEAAIDSLEQLSRASPSDAATLRLLGMLYGIAHKYDKAIEVYTTLISIEPESAVAIHSRGDVLLGIGKHAEAIADYERALKLDPKDQSLLNNLAWVLATSPVDKLRNGSRAIKLATDACKLTEYKEAYILSTLAAAYAETGDFKTAIEWSKKAVALGKGKQRESLAKELAGYEAGKPVRELKTGNEKDDDDEPAAVKDDKAKK